jgi:hypothetical protein
LWVSPARCFVGHRHDVVWSAPRLVYHRHVVGCHRFYMFCSDRTDAVTLSMCVQTNRAEDSST